MKIAMVGSRGVPARYGGFETAIEEIGWRLAAAGHEILVFCRSTPTEETLSEHRGMTLVQIPALRTRTLETLSRTAMSVVHRSLRGTDAAILFNAANSPLLPIFRLRGIPVATHVDGLEWRRSKWGPTGRRYYRLAESLAVRWSHELIADAQGIADYYRDEFSAPSRLIAYGATQLDALGSDRLEDLLLEPGGYHLVVARFEPENHVLEIVQGYVTSSSSLPLVVVGSAPYSDAYTTAVRQAADERVRLVGGVWDQALLDQLYANCASYLHGHSVGGTNPSLLRAAGAGAPVLAFDSVFNREVARDDGEFFDGPRGVARLLKQIEGDPASARAMGDRLKTSSQRYSWDGVAEEYARLCADLASGLTPTRRLSGRRNRPGWQEPHELGVVQAKPTPIPEDVG